MPKKSKKIHYSIFRIIRYDAYSVERTRHGGIVETTWTESLTVTFFFDQKNTVLLHTIRHRHKDSNGNLRSGKYHNIVGDPDELWPDSVCDGIFHKIYETQKADPHWYAGDKYFKKCVWYKKLNSDIKSGLFK